MNVKEVVAKVTAAVEAAQWARIPVPPEASDAFRGIVPGLWVLSVVAWKDQEGIERCDGVATDAHGLLVRLLPEQAKQAVRLARAAIPVN